MNDLGEQHGYVGEAIDPNWTPNPDPAEPFDPGFVPEGMVAMPKPGIYFGFDEDEYHKVFALSSSGIKKMVASTMEYWAYGPMNPDYEEPEKQHLDHGKAVHCLVLEGEEEFQRRFAVGLDPADFEDVLISTDEIKNAIGQFTEHRPVTPAAGGKQDLMDQLDALGQKWNFTPDLDGTVAQLKERIRAVKEPQPVRPYSRIPTEQGTRSAAKEDWIAQLRVLNPDIKIWDHMVQQHLAANEGKVMLSPKQERQVRIAARMITADPDGGLLVKNGHSEVTIFWHCHTTGVPMKARIDYLRLAAAVDLKTFSNAQGKPVDKAIEQAIANYRYNVQHAHYDQAILMGRRLVAEHGPDVIFPSGDMGTGPETDFCERWCQQEQPPMFIFIFQQSGIAPVTRIWEMPREEIFKGSMRLIEDIAIQWRECCEKYGADPWLDIAPMRKMPDEAIPLYATERRGYYD